MSPFEFKFQIVANQNPDSFQLEATFSDDFFGLSATNDLQILLYFRTITIYTLYENI